MNQVKTFMKTNTSLECKDLLSNVLKIENCSIESVRKLNNLFIHIMEEIPEFIFIYSLNNEKVIYVNKNEFCGHPIKNPNELVLLSDSIHINDQPILRELFKRYHDNVEQGSIEIEFRMKNPAGEWEWVHVKLSALTLNEQNVPETIVCSSTIITEYKTTQEKMTIQKEELSNFAHTMAHDLRSFLTAIEGYAILLQTNWEKEYIEKIITQVKNTNDLLQKSLSLADTGLIVKKTTYVDLNRFIPEVVEVTIPKNIKCLFNDLPTIYADKDRLFQIFKNIFENAVIHGKPSLIEIRKRIFSKGIYLYISNNGKQIPEHVRKTIFKQNSMFNGLPEQRFGLKIVQKLVEAHTWKIELLSKLETTFRIYIPIKDIKN